MLKFFLCQSEALIEKTTKKTERESQDKRWFVQYVWLWETRVSSVKKIS